MTRAAELAPHLVTEAALQQAVVDLAHLQGWWTFHDEDPRRNRAGWPDLVLLRPPQALFVELKRQDGKVRPDQAHVLELLERAGLDTRIWRPADWPEIETVLRRTR